MKNFIILVVCFILVISSNVFAETGITKTTGIVEGTGVIETTGVIINTGSFVEPQIIKTTKTESETNISDASYIYYYGQGCSHCGNVDKYMKAVDGYDKLNIVKKEIYFDDDNREEYLAAGERLGFAEEELGIPFLVINNSGEEIALAGDVTIIEYFEGYLGEAPSEASKKIIFLVIGLLLLSSPFVLLHLTSKK